MKDTLFATFVPADTPLLTLAWLIVAHQRDSCECIHEEPNRGIYGAKSCRGIRWNLRVP